MDDDLINKLNNLDDLSNIFLFFYNTFNDQYVNLSHLPILDEHRLLDYD